MIPPRIPRTDFIIKFQTDRKKEELNSNVDDIIDWLNRFSNCFVLHIIKNNYKY